MQKLFDTTEAAALLCVKANTLERWRLTGEGPAFCKIGRLVKYSESAIQDYIQRQTRTSTSDRRAA
jgi:predicted DNA-binding transcriptional regulator AlpA